MIMKIAGPQSWLLFLIVVLSACSTDPAKIEANVFPTDYKKLIIESLKKDKLIGAREASITDPTLRQIDNAERYAVCVRYNPRMSDSPGYTGLTERLVYFYQGHMTQFLQATPEQCSWAAYKPFPELEKACVGAGCE
ncbi:MAG: hypothetical protein JOZ94_28005 [Xanthobacteraceae bacterium]|nr:hypothetical protein [Xanthobacteraceae bacterium]MBV9632471.1 hypothetical protein [Xanthobacteraceae bacterium]